MKEQKGKQDGKKKGIITKKSIIILNKGERSKRIVPPIICQKK